MIHKAVKNATVKMVTVTIKISLLSNTSSKLLNKNKNKKIRSVGRTFFSNTRLKSILFPNHIVFSIYLPTLHSFSVFHGGFYVQLILKSLPNESVLFCQEHNVIRGQKMICGSMAPDLVTIKCRFKRVNRTTEHWSFDAYYATHHNNTDNLFVIHIK